MLPRSSQLNRTLHLANRTLEDNISMSWTQLGPDGLFIPQQMTGAVCCFGTSAISHLYRTGRSSAASGVNAWSHDAPSRTVCKSIAITATASGWLLPPTTEQQYQYQLRNICKIRSSMIMKSFMLSSRHVYYTFFSLNSHKSKRAKQTHEVLACDCTGDPWPLDIMSSFYQLPSRPIVIWYHIISRTF